MLQSKGKSVPQTSARFRGCLGRIRTCQRQPGSFYWTGMKRKLDLVFRSCVFAFVALLVWTVWIQAQTNTTATTNAVSRRGPVNAADSGRNGSIVHTDQLTFG